MKIKTLNHVDRMPAKRQDCRKMIDFYLSYDSKAKVRKGIEFKEVFLRFAKRYLEKAKRYLDVKPNSALQRLNS